MDRIRMAREAIARFLQRSKDKEGPEEFSLTMVMTRSMAPNQHQAKSDRWSLLTKRQIKEERSN